MTTLAEQRCVHHPARGAVARCPSCKTFFCRECVTEHEGRMVCRRCLDRMTGEAAPKRKPHWTALVALQCMVGLFILWTWFYVVGRLILAVPGDFHEGQVWKPILLEQQGEP